MVGAVTSPLAAGSAPAKGTIAVARSRRHAGLHERRGRRHGRLRRSGAGRPRPPTEPNYDADEAVSLGATVARRCRRGAVSILPPGRTLATGRESGSPYVDGSPELRDHRGRRGVHPRGTIVATVSGRQLRRVRLRGPPDVAPDGRHVVFTTSADDSARPGVVLTSVATGKSRRLARGSGFETTWSLDVAAAAPTAG